MDICFEAASGLFAMVAAALWFASAVTRIPHPSAYWADGEIPDDDPFVVATKKAARSNALAALFSGLSAAALALQVGGHAGAAYLEARESRQHIKHAVPVVPRQAEDPAHRV